MQVSCYFLKNNKKVIYIVFYLMCIIEWLSSIKWTAELGNNCLISILVNFKILSKISLTWLERHFNFMYNQIWIILML